MFAPRIRPASLVLLALIWAASAGAAELRVIVNPARATSLSESELRAIYLKQRLYWGDGKPMVPVNRASGSAAREIFSRSIFRRDSRDLASYWNQRYFEAGDFPPATLDSDEAVLRFVATNSNAIGYVAAEIVDASVHVALEIEQ